MTEREKKHVSAMQLLADGQFQNASLLWQEILKEHPMDILALRLAHDCCTLLGDKDQLRDIPGGCHDQADAEWIVIREPT